MQFEDYDSVPRCTVPPVSDRRDSTECGLSNFTVQVCVTKASVSEMKLLELRDALRAWKCSHTFRLLSHPFAQRHEVNYLLADINVTEAGTTKSTFMELTRNTFHITVQVRCSVGESVTGLSGEGATQC